MVVRVLAVTAAQAAGMVEREAVTAVHAVKVVHAVRVAQVGPAVRAGVRAVSASIFARRKSASFVSRRWI